MRKLSLVSLCLMLSLSLVVSLAIAKDGSNGRINVNNLNKLAAGGAVPLPEGYQELPATAAATTTYLASFTFDSLVLNCKDEGFGSVDFTAQLGEFFHVAGPAELTGGDYGGLFALEGNNSVWCGAYATAPTNPPNALCGYASLPGYGSNWDQGWCTKACLEVGDEMTTGSNVTLTYLASWDSEPNWDGTVVQIDACDGNWIRATPDPPTFDYDDFVVDSLCTVTIADSLHTGTLRIRFQFTSDGNTDDADGNYNSDGGIIIDSLGVKDSGGPVLAVDTFEDETPSPTTLSSNDWESCPGTAYGDFAGLINAQSTLQRDPCDTELSCVWEFFDEFDEKGDTGDYSCLGLPEGVGVPVTPYLDPDGLFHDNHVFSPPIPWGPPAFGATARFQFDYYADLPDRQVVYQYWHIRSEVAGCFMSWLDNFGVRFSDDPVWVRGAIRDISPFVPGNADNISVSAGPIDLCLFWCDINNPGNCHSNAPLLDNFEVYRIATSGPVWNILGFTLFQDTFYGDDEVSGTTRMDICQDKLPFQNPAYLAGDSCAVRCADPDNGIAVSGGLPEVFAYITLWPQGQAGKLGTAPVGGGLLSEDPIYNIGVVGTYVDVNGITWYKVQMDTAFGQGNIRQQPGNDSFCFDLNDNLFTAGDTICYFFEAVSANTGATSYWIEPEPTGTFGGYTTTDIAIAAANPVEVQVLPSNQPGRDILYVDAYDGRGVQPYYDTAFKINGIYDKVDRYDYRMTTSDQGNGPGNEVKNTNAQITQVYKKIVWGNGRTVTNLMDDGSQKSDDATVVYDFLNNSTLGGGLWYVGNSAGTELYSSTETGMVNLSNYCQGSVTNPDHYAAGFGRLPLLVGTSGGPFTHGVLGPDTMIADGSCPAAEQFDVLLNQVGVSSIFMEYRYGGNTGGAVLGQISQNAATDTVGFLLSGVSFYKLRNGPGHVGLPDRAHHMADVMTWLNNPVGTATGAKPAGLVNSLSQNYPNPFNPQTTIKFSLKERAHVTLKVYNVAGQLVKTLVDGVRNAGTYDNLTWDGRNNAGQNVSSGVYFYKLVTKGFTQTKKMVLLK